MMVWINLIPRIRTFNSMFHRFLTLESRTISSKRFPLKILFINFLTDLNMKISKISLNCTCDLTWSWQIWIILVKSFQDGHLGLS